MVTAYKNTGFDVVTDHENTDFDVVTEFKNTGFDVVTSFFWCSNIGQVYKMIKSTDMALIYLLHVLGITEHRF